MSTTEIIKDTVEEFAHARKVVGVAAAVLGLSIRLTRGVQLKTPEANVAPIYIGKSESVTAGTNAATDGFPLDPGEGLFVPVNDLSKIYAISTAADQDLYWMAV